MQSFKEWVEKNHPEDEVLEEFLKDLASGKVGKFGRSLALATAIGSVPAGAEAAISSVPQISQEEGNSQKPFNRELTISLAKEMNASPDRLMGMSDFDLWHWQMTKVARLETEMARNNAAVQRGAMGVSSKPWPRWYIKFGTYYGWKAPKAPEVMPGGTR